MELKYIDKEGTLDIYSKAFDNLAWLVSKRPRYRSMSTGWVNESRLGCRHGRHRRKYRGESWNKCYDISYNIFCENICVQTKNLHKSKKRPWIISHLKRLSHIRAKLIAMGTRPYKGGQETKVPSLLLVQIRRCNSIQFFFLLSFCSTTAVARLFRQ